MGTPQSRSRVRNFRNRRHYYDDQIGGAQFALENEGLARQIATLEEEQRDAHRARDARTVAAGAFHRVAELLQGIEIGVLWDEATPGEKQTLISDLIVSINFYPDQLTVQVVGAPAIKVELSEVGLVAGIKRMVSTPIRPDVNPHAKSNP